MITRSYPIAALNCISLILLVMIMYFFYSLTMSSFMSNEYGFRGINCKVMIITQILMFSTQGLYSTSFFFKESLKKTINLISTFDILFLLMVNILYSLTQINFGFFDKISFFLKFINNFCFCSGVVEIYLYLFVAENDKCEEIHNIVFFIFELVNGLLLS